MSKKRSGGLGLDWIGEKPKSMEVLPTPESCPMPEETVAPAMQADQSICSLSQPGSSSYEELLKQYEYHQQQLKALQLPMLEARLNKSVAERGSMEKQAPKKGKRVASSQQGLADGWSRITVIMREENIDKLKQCADTHDSTIKDLLDLAVFKLFKSL